MENNIIILAILFNCLSSLVFLIPSNFYYLAFNQLTLSVPDEDYSNQLTLSVPDEDYSRNSLCEINLISTFLITF